MTAPPLARISVSNIAWSADENPAVAAMLARRGVAAIEVAPANLFTDPAAATPSDVDRIRGFWSAHGIRIVAMQGLLFGRPELALFTDARARAALRSYLDHIIVLAARLGCGPLVFGSPGNRRRGELPLDQALSQAADFFRPVAAFAHDHGCTLCFEPNAAGYGCDFVRTIGEAREIAQRVGHPGFRVQLDVGNFMMEDDDIAQVRAAASLIGHCHASAPNLAPPGETPSPLAELVAAADAGGYRGLVSIEMRRPAAGIAAVERALDYVTQSIAGVDG